MYILILTIFASTPRQRMESVIVTSGLKLSGIWYKRPRIVMRSMNERSTLRQISTSVGTSLEVDVVRILVETWVP